MEEDFDIYTDLPNIDLAKSNINDEPNTDHTCNCEELKEKFSLLTNKFESISKANKNLEKNLASLLKTAKAEIERKDKTIEELRNQLDNTVFRRNNNRSLHSSNLRSSYPCNTMAEKYENITSLIHSEENIFISEQIEPHHTEYKSKKSQKIDQVPVTIFGERLQKRIMDDAKEERRQKALSNLSSEANVNKIPEESIVESDKENGSQSIINNNINESNVITRSSNSGTLYKKNSGKRPNEEEDTRKRKHFKANDNENRHDDIEYNSIAPYDTKDDLTKLQDQPCVANSFKQEQVPLEPKRRASSEYGDTKRARNYRNRWEREESMSSTRSYDNFRSSKRSTDSSRNHRITSKRSERFNSDYQYNNYVDGYRKNYYRYGSSSSRSYFKSRSDHESSSSHRLREKSGKTYRDRKYDDYKYDSRYRNGRLRRGYNNKEIDSSVEVRSNNNYNGECRNCVDENVRDYASDGSVRLEETYDFNNRNVGRSEESGNVAAESSTEVNKLDNPGTDNDVRPTDCKDVRSSTSKDTQVETAPNCDSVDRGLVSSANETSRKKSDSSNAEATRMCLSDHNYVRDTVIDASNVDAVPCVPECRDSASDTATSKETEAERTINTQPVDIKKPTSFTVKNKKDQNSKTVVVLRRRKAVTLSDNNASMTVLINRDSAKSPIVNNFASDKSDSVSKPRACKLARTKAAL